MNTVLLVVLVSNQSFRTQRVIAFDAKHHSPLVCADALLAVVVVLTTAAVGQTSCCRIRITEARQRLNEGTVL